MTTRTLTVVPPTEVTEAQINKHFDAREWACATLPQIEAEAHRLDANFVAPFVAQATLDVNALVAGHVEVGRNFERRAALEHFRALVEERISVLKSTWPSEVETVLRERIAILRSKKDTAQGIADGIEQKLELLTEELEQMLSSNDETADDDAKSKPRRSRRRGEEKA